MTNPEKPSPAPPSLSGLAVLNLGITLTITLLLTSVLNGEETEISRGEYENLLAEKDRNLPSAKLLVDKTSGTAFAKTGDRWKKIPFRGRRKEPFLLLCIYARYPGTRFTASQLEFMLKDDLENREGFNVSDFFVQLRKRAPLVPVQRDDEGSYLPKTVNVCFVDQRDGPSAAGAEPPDELLA